MVKMKSGFWYLAHPYSSETIEERIANFELACRRSAKLLLKGYNIFSPIVHSHPIEMASPEMMAWPQEKLWKFWLDVDVAILEYVGFTGLILSPGWHESRGCRREYEWFTTHLKCNGEPYEILKYNDIMGD